MNIIVIPSWYENKSNRTLGSFFREQAESLASMGHNVYVLYVDIIRFNEVNRMLATPKLYKYTKNGITVYRRKKIKIPKTKEKHVYKMVENGIEELYLTYINKKIKIDIIHAHSFIWGGCAGTILGKKYNIPIMVTEHYTGYARKLFSNDEKNIIKYSINNADKVVAVSNGLKNSLKEYMCDKEKEIEIIPNMVDTDLFNNMKNNIDVKKNEKFIFLSICYLMHKKGIDLLLKCFKKAFDEQDDVKLIIGGDGEEKENLIKLCRELAIEEKVEFLGALSRENVAKKMIECNCFVLPSRFETFGVVYIEALATGKPVIATNTDAIYDIIDKNNGLIVEKENEEQLIKALIKMKNEYNKYNSNLISKSCIDKFGKENVSKMIENSLIDTVNKKHVRR